MCGIAGFIYRDKNRLAEANILKEMLSLIVHRGPDDEGIFVYSNIAMGMRRLKIIDLETGSQPIFNEDRSKVIVYNGEFYTFKEWKKVLKNSHRFYTKTDTEVILHLYEEYGIEFLKKLRGMYAFSIFDKKKNQLIIVRDRVGIKPLYYTITEEGTLVYGSELKTILVHPEVKKELNPQALNFLLTLEYIPSPYTLFKNIHKLKPGHYLFYDNGNIKIEKYWDIEPDDEIFDEKKAKEGISEILKEAVKMRLISDVPLGAFLSGGVDSSTIVANMRFLNTNPLMTFSIGFEEKSYNELPYAEKVSKKFNTIHYVKYLKPNIGELFEKLIFHLDDPIGDFSIFPTYLVSKIARERVTVALSGDGGDELFSGYEHYIAQKLSKLLNFFPAKHVLKLADQLLPPSPKKKGLVNRVKRFSKGLMLDKNLRHFRWMIFASEKEKREIFTGDFLKEIEISDNLFEIEPLNEIFIKAKEFDPVNGELYIDFKTYLTDNILVKVDRMSMAESLETRVPLLDHEFVEFVFKISGNLKLKGLRTKHIFKEYAKSFLPQEIIEREKQGFSIPIKNWLKKELKELLLENLNEDSIKEDGIFSYKGVKKLIDEHLSGKENHSHILWGILVFQMWKKRFFL